VTWPLPEPDVGAELGELRPPEDERPEFFDVPELPLDACWLLLPDPEEPDEAVAAPGRLNATAPAAITLAAAADTVAARSRAPPRSLAATRAAMLCLRSLMSLSVPTSSRHALWATSELPMSGPASQPANFGAGGSAWQDRSVLAGRGAELSELHGAAVRAAAERRGWVGLVGGEPGIGKTQLAAACAARLAADGFGCAWVTCPEDDGAPPFWLWGRLLDQLGVSDVLSPGRQEADPELARFLLFEAVAAAVREAAAKRPLLLVVDDLHWADPGSRRLLAAIRGALATLPVVALGTYRDTEPAGDALCAEVGPERHLVLGGLAPGELAAAVRMATGSAVPDALRHGLHARTAGNPYFAAEAVRLLRAEGRLDASAQLPGELLPPTVRAVLERRLARLPPAAVGLLRVAALLGDELDPPLVAGVTGEPLAVVAEALAAAQTARVVSRDRFAHPLVREVLDAQLGPAERLRWHARAGALLAGRYQVGGAGPAAAARHLLAAAELGGEAVAAVEFARLAAADAVRRAGYEDAVRLLSGALVFAGPDSDRGELLCAAGEAALAAGDPDRARAAFAEATELARRAGRPELLAAAALGMAGGQGGFEINLRDPERVPVLTEALAAQPDGDSKTRAALLGRLSLALAFTEAAPQQREALSTEAVGMARRLGDPAVLALALAARCDAISGPDHVAERRAAAAEIIELARAGGDRTGEMLGRRLLVVALAEAGDWPAVDAEISSYARVAGDLAQQRLTWYVPLWRGARALMRGDLALADEYGRELFELAERAGSVNARLLALVQRFVRLESDDRAGELAGDFAEILSLVPNDPQAGGCAHALLSARLGQLAVARADLDRVVAATVPRDGDWLAKHVQISVAAVLADHRPAAEAAYEQLKPYEGQCAVGGIMACSWGSVAAHLGLLARYLGRAGEAGPHFARAAELDAAAGAGLAARTRDWARGAETPDGVAVFRLEGDVRTLRYAGRTVRLRDSKGLRDLAVLLGRPDEQTHVGELTGAAGLPGSDVGPVADRRAIEAYRARLRRIGAELDSADAGAAEAEVLKKEREALLAELSAVTGLGGRPRVAGSPAERMRKAVTYRIRHAITRVAEAHPELGRHLQASVRTGTWCSYAPEQPVDWQQ
jgi:tetratricopeptide (TPR) repeat protein